MEPAIFINRELSWLDFNSRVLEEAADQTLPLLDRLKFVAIFSNNLDEFFMVRVAGLMQQHQTGEMEPDPAGLSPGQQLERVREKVVALQRRQYQIVKGDILPALREHGVFLLQYHELAAAEKDELRRFFDNEILPVLTPVAVDPSHPFPFLASGALEIAVRLRLPQGGKTHHAFVEVPRVLARFIEVRGRTAKNTVSFVFLEDLILANIQALFPNCRIIQALPCRVIRDMDLTLEEEGIADLLAHLRSQLRRRRRRDPVRLEVSTGSSSPLVRWLGRELDLKPDSVYHLAGHINHGDFFSLVEKIRRPDLLEPEWLRLDAPQLPANQSVFAAVRRHGTIPLFLPFEKFDPIVRLLEEAADDPTVLAIKQTLYRVSGESPVVRALQRAAENGKQVTVIVEIKARFDEERNIQWARTLEESGAHVAYGIVGLKIHGKALLIIRREEGRICRYLHLATGNYNDRTARIYTDIGMFTNDPDLCMDAAALFNVMTGYSEPPQWYKMAVAPYNLRRTFLDLIDRETRLATPHNPGHIIAKLNSLADPEIIEHLYAAARNGVKVDLICRGICCLRPGVNTDNIRVVSIVDRYLEHSRIYYFANGGSPECFLASADWMERNLDRRIEILFPVEDEAMRELLEQMLRIGLADRRKGRRLQDDGTYTRPSNRFNPSRSQRCIYELFLNRRLKL